MAEVKVLDERSVENFYLVEGFPGIGLVANIAADFLVEDLEMQIYAKIYSDSIPVGMTFDRKSYSLRPEICIYSSFEHELLVLKTDVPVSGSSHEFIEAVTDWIIDEELRPVHLLGFPARDFSEQVFGLSTGDAESVLDEAGIDKPPALGAVGGPSGALLEKADRNNVDSVALVVEADPYFPDPEASRILIEDGVSRVTGIDFSAGKLSEAAEEIKNQQEELAAILEKAVDEKTSGAYPEDMYGSG
mgnify:FL=1